MKTNDKTLADAQPGGRVQVMPSDVARALLAAQYRDDGDKAKAIRINHKSLTDSDKRALRAIEAALSAPPSPGGQDALAVIEEAAELNRACAALDPDYKGPSDAAVQAAIAALAARQPVGEPVAWLIERLCGKDYGRDKYVVMKGQASSDPDSHLFWTDQQARDNHRVTPLYEWPAQAVDLGK